MENKKEDTIAAIATPVGNGGIGIIRISGPVAHIIAERIFKKKRSSSSSSEDGSAARPHLLRNRTLHFGQIVDPETNRVIDEVLLVKMAAPHSYTCEDITEIQAHASAVGLKMILELVLKNGARLSEPGEFTKRAFLNGRIDLTQAEAVMDVITARTEKSLRIATRQLNGGLRNQIQNIIQELTKILSLVESSIDFSEEVEDIIESSENFEGFRRNVISPLKMLIKNYRDGHFLRDGLRLVIVGRPNVGKSSLMNCLLKKERAIVSTFPGTTRDTIEEQINIKGLPVLLSDTAGVHNSVDPVESIGIQRTEQIAGEADLILFMIDAGDGVTSDDISLYEKIKTKPIILIINKIDLERNEGKTPVPQDWCVRAIVRISVHLEEGIAILKDEIYENSIRLNDAENDSVVPNLRQKEMLEKTLLSTEIADEAMKTGVPAELTAIDLREAIGVLNQMIGKDPEIDILDDIFRRFCIGK
jgi:tRNA modification GTPase